MKGCEMKEAICSTCSYGRIQRASGLEGARITCLVTGHHMSIKKCPRGLKYEQSKENVSNEPENKKTA